jgi:hypothetical protein
MENTNDNRQQQGGTGGAEHTDRQRQEQQSGSSGMSDKERGDMASQIGEKKNNVTTIADMGGLSGRDDAAGGSGDRMEDQSTNQGTEKF